MTTSPSRPEHVRQRRADGVDRALEVDVEHLVEVLAGEVEERPVGADARVRDDDVDPAETLGGRVTEIDERVEVADVAGARDDTLEPEIVAAAGGEAEVAAAVVEHACHRGADAAARAGDHRGLAFQAHRFLQWSEGRVEPAKAA